MQVRIAMELGALPLYLQCQAIAHGTTGQEWAITGIELYRDPSYSLNALVADDIAFASLPESSQMQLAAHVEDHWQAQHARRYFEQVHARVMGSLTGGVR